jgi:hypothetical protein
LTDHSSIAKDLSAEVFKQNAKVDIVHVPYRGAREAVTAIARGDAQMYFAPIPSAQELGAAGKVAVVAINSSAARSAAAEGADNRGIRPAQLQVRVLVRDVGAGRDIPANSRQDQSGYREGGQYPGCARAWSNKARCGSLTHPSSSM